MVSSAQALKKYGEPSQTNPNMILWDVPTELEIGIIPKRIYCNKDLVGPLSKAFKALITTGHVKELKTWDGCFNIRKKRGLTTMSLHSWGIAVDVNSASNQLGKSYDQLIKEGRTPLSEGFLKCFRDNGFDCGGDWVNRPDRMHFQLAKI
jgi:hypothetical protein